MRMSKPSSLMEILYPESIAVIGASKDQTKRGFRSIDKLLADGYRGAIHPINPKEREILGLRCYPAVSQVQGPIDLALICTPARTLPDIIRECGAKGVKGAVVLAGGFAESGEEGRILQEEMTAVAREVGVRIIGPNTSGVFNTHKSCNIVGFADLRRGGIGLLSQSGNMALSLATEAQAHGHIGLSTYVGIGNEADVRFDEYLDYFAEDPNTHVVAVYVEGLKDGSRFLAALRRLTRVKPVVVYKSGRTSAGISAARSHTGALAGDYAVSAGVLRQAGAVLAERSDEILAIAESLSSMPRLASRRIAVLADGGGHATIAADTLVGHGLALATLADDTRHKLAMLLPPAAAIANPVDVAGGTDSHPELLADCARILLDDAGVDGLLISGVYGGYAVRFSDSLIDMEIEASRRIAMLPREYSKPVLVHSLYGVLHGALRPTPLIHLREAGIPVHDSLERAVRCMQALAEFAEGSARRSQVGYRAAMHSADVEKIMARCRREGRRVVLEHEGRAMLEAAGVPMARACLATAEKDVPHLFAELGGVPVAMKIVAPSIIHKADAGGVELKIASAQEAQLAFARIQANACRAGASDIRGVLMTPMAAGHGIEIIIGVVRDPSYGHVMMFGIGGVFVEVLRDVVFRAVPLTEADAREMLDGIKASAVLDGVRGAPPVDREALVELLLRVSELVTAHPEIAELDLNPVLALPSELDVLDVRILLVPDGGAMDEQQTALPETVVFN
jgi:acetate---CoA ligase (ADP-forming)